MKAKKFVSLLCAISMLLTSAITASAAEPLSEYAGQTVPVHVTHFDADGNATVAETTVDIPADATQSEAQVLLNQAARSAVLPTARSAARLIDLAAWGGVSLNSSFTTIGEVFLDDDYSRLYFNFNNVTYTGNPTRVSIKLIDGASDGLTYTGAFRNYGTNTKVAEIIIVDGTSYGGVTAHFYNGDAFDLACRVNSGSVNCGGIIVYGE